MTQPNEVLAKDHLLLFLSLYCKLQNMHAKRRVRRHNVHEVQTELLSGLSKKVQRSVHEHQHEKNLPHEAETFDMRGWSRIQVSAGIVLSELSFCVKGEPVQIQYLARTKNFNIVRSLQNEVTKSFHLGGGAEVGFKFPG